MSLCFLCATHGQKKRTLAAFSSSLQTPTVPASLLLPKERVLEFEDELWLFIIFLNLLHTCWSAFSIKSRSNFICLYTHTHIYTRVCAHTPGPMEAISPSGPVDIFFFIHSPSISLSPLSARHFSRYWGYSSDEKRQKSLLLVGRSSQ